MKRFFQPLKIELPGFFLSWMLFVFLSYKKLFLFYWSELNIKNFFREKMNEVLKLYYQKIKLFFKVERFLLLKKTFFLPGQCPKDIFKVLIQHIFPNSHFSRRNWRLKIFNFYLVCKSICKLSTFSVYVVIFKTEKINNVTNKLVLFMNFTCRIGHFIKRILLK